MTCEYHQKLTIDSVRIVVSITVYTRTPAVITVVNCPLVTECVAPVIASIDYNEYSVLGVTPYHRRSHESAPSVSCKTMPMHLRA